jgi:hypothetical protein
MQTSFAVWVPVSMLKCTLIGYVGFQPLTTDSRSNPTPEGFEPLTKSSRSNSPTNCTLTAPPCLCYNASTKRKPTDSVINLVTPVAQEAPITFRKVKIQLYIDIYNARISYPLAIILLAMGNIKAYF